jgi:ubiquitin carboxyl-terminal hydrolase 7
MVRNLPWRILATSKLIKNQEYGLALFLQCNFESESKNWSVNAAAQLKLLHTTDPEKNIVKRIQHLFFHDEDDWGFSPFALMNEIMDPNKGYYNAQKDCITLEVELNAS